MEHYSAQSTLNLPPHPGLQTTNTPASSAAHGAHVGGLSSGLPGSHTASTSSPSSSSLKLSIALSGVKPTIIHKGHFYLMRSDGIPVNDVTGATNLMASKGLEHSYLKLTTKKMKDSLSSFLPHLPGNIDTPGSQDNSSLRGLIEKPPVCGKELGPLTQLQLAGFRLHPGPLPEQYRSLMQTKKKHKKHKHKHRGSETPVTAPGSEYINETFGGEEREKKREKKHKKHDKDAEDRKKRKKEKKKKKNKEDKDLV